MRHYLFELLKLGASDVDKIGQALGNKSVVVTKRKVKKKDTCEPLEKKSKVEASSLKRKAVEAFQLPGIQTETPPKVFV